MTDETYQDAKSIPPPYTSFRTLMNLLERLESEKAVPPRIDRGLLGGSEGSKTQLLSALKFLSLISDEGVTRPGLEALATDPEHRPGLLRKIIEQRYPEQIRLGSVNATQQQLEESFATLTGATRRKAVAFYLHAAEYAKLPVSKFFKTPRIGRPPGSSGTPRRRNRESVPDRSGGIPARDPVHNGDARQRYIELLMKRVESGDELDEKLLDRIETLLGFQNTQG